MSNYKNVENLEVSENVTVEEFSNSNGNFTAFCNCCKKAAGYAVKEKKLWRFIRYNFASRSDTACKECRRDLYQI